MIGSKLREALPVDLPWAIKELIIANVVVGNFNRWQALAIAQAIANKLKGVEVK
jgi:hypothetical protein